MSQITELAEELWDSGEFDTKKAVAVEIVNRLGLDKDPEAIRKKISKHLNKLQKQKDFAGPIAEAKELGVNFDNVKSGWIKNKNISLYFKNNEDIVDYDTIKEDLLSELRNIKIEIPEVKREIKGEKKYSMIIGASDFHISALSHKEVAEENNSDIIIKRITKGLDALLVQASPYNFEEIVLMIGSDLFHTEASAGNYSKTRTTSGTGPLLVDSDFHVSFLRAKDLYINIITRLIPLCDTLHVKLVIGNHAGMTEWMLQQCLMHIFSDHPSIKFDCDWNYTKWHLYGQNSFMFLHGHGVKENQLPLKFAVEGSTYFHQGPMRYIISGHYHHRIAKDTHGIDHTVLRVPKPQDEYEALHGWHSTAALEAFIHHKEYGRVATLHHIYPHNPDRTKNLIL